MKKCYDIIVVWKDQIEKKYKIYLDKDEIGGIMRASDKAKDLFVKDFKVNKEELKTKLDTDNPREEDIKEIIERLGEMIKK